MIHHHGKYSGHNKIHLCRHLPRRDQPCQGGESRGRAHETKAAAEPAAMSIEWRCRRVGLAGSEARCQERTRAQGCFPSVRPNQLRPSVPRGPIISVRRSSEGLPTCQAPALRHSLAYDALKPSGSGASILDPQPYPLLGIPCGMYPP